MDRYQEALSELDAAARLDPERTLYRARREELGETDEGDEFPLTDFLADQQDSAGICTSAIFSRVDELLTLKPWGEIDHGLDAIHDVSRRHKSGRSRFLAREMICETISGA